MNAVALPTPTRKPCATWPRFRMAQRDFASRWFVAPDVADADLAGLGYRLGGPTRDASHLDDGEQEDLARVLGLAKDAQSAADRALESQLLARCPFQGAMPPLDLDVADGTTRDQVVDAAGQLREELLLADFGDPVWFTTGGRGLHGDQRAPEGVASLFLLRAYGRKLRSLSRRAGVPLLTEHRSKLGRPPVVLDDSLFDRDADARGVVWRLAGSWREEGKRKAPIYLYGSGAIPPVNAPPRPASPKRVLEALRDHVLEVAVYEGWSGGMDAPGFLDVLLLEPGEGQLQRLRREASTSRSRTPVSGSRVIDLGPTVPALARTAQALAQADPGHRRHDYRLAAAGWLLRRGLAPNLVEATLGGIGEATYRDDATSAVRTTVARLAANERCKGLPWLRSFLGEENARGLEAALDADLNQAGVTSALGALLSEDDRKLMREAAELAAQRWETRLRQLPPDHKDRQRKTGRGGPHATTLRRAAKCGYARQRPDCERCDRPQGKPAWILAENDLCPHCAAKKAAGLAKWIEYRWPEDLGGAVMRLQDDSPDAAKKAKRDASRQIPKRHHTNLRWLIGPGFVAVVTTDTYALAGIRAADGFRQADHLGNSELRELIAPVLAARARRLRTFLGTRNLEALASDAWVTRVGETTAGKGARKLLPWPKKEDLRILSAELARERAGLAPADPADLLAEIKRKATERFTPCCQAHYVWKLLGPGNQVVAFRRDLRFTSDEAVSYIREFRRTGRVTRCDREIPEIDLEDIPAPPDASLPLSST